MTEGLNPGLDKIFNRHDKEFGNTRPVWQMNGREGVDFIVKARQGQTELDILKFLSESGMSEKLLAYDDNTLVLSKIDGMEMGDYLDDLVDKHPQKITESTATQSTDNPRFKITEQKTNSVPTASVLEQGEIRKFYIDYISKVMTLVLCGVFHRDVKVNNIMVTPNGETRFIDFGVSMKSERGSKPTIHRAWDEVNALLEILEKLNPAFHDHLPDMNSINSWWKLFEELYSKFEQIPLKERPKIVLEILKYDRLKNLLQEMNFPGELIPELAERIIKQLQKI